MLNRRLATTVATDSSLAFVILVAPKVRRIFFFFSFFFFIAVLNHTQLYAGEMRADGWAHGSSAAVACQIGVQLLCYLPRFGGTCLERAALALVA